MMEVFETLLIESDGASYTFYTEGYRELCHFVARLHNEASDRVRAGEIPNYTVFVHEMTEEEVA